MDDAELRRRMDAGMPAFWGSLAAATLARPRPHAAICPTLPERSVPNSLFAADAAGLAALIADAESAWRSAGVRAAAAWVDGADEDGRAVLASRGWRLDERLLRMGRPLPAAPLGDDARAVVACAPATVAGIVDGSFAGAIGGAVARAPDAIAYRIGDDACLVGRDEGDDLGIYVVGTRPAARRQGLASALVGRALHDAAERGRTSATLQASAAGAGVYARLGFRAVGSIEIWERRPLS